MNRRAGRTRPVVEIGPPMVTNHLHPRSTCWHCNESIGSGDNYCGDCGAPLSEFQTRRGEGFLSRRSRTYLDSILDGTVTYPVDSNLDPDLQESLRSQLEEDVRAAFGDMAFVCGADDRIVFRSVDFEPVLEWDSAKRRQEGLPVSLLGFLRLLKCIAEVFPPRVLEVFGNDADD